MKKVILIVLSVLTLTNLIMLIIALTDPTSVLFPYRLVIGIFLLMFGGFLRRHIVHYNKSN